MEELTKKEKRALIKEEKRKKRKRQEVASKTKKLVILILVIGILAGGGYWFYKSAIKPLPGQEVADLGREHVPDGMKIEYNSNPPTSGPHYREWTRAGVYGQPISDGHLVHSLEHGYVIISYNCLGEVLSVIRPVYAHEEELETSADATDSGQITEGLSGEWEKKECKDLIAKLTSIYKKKGERKLIVIPRPSLDNRIALTAWGRIDKFDKLDEERVISFIDALRDRGPEKTVE